MIRFDQQTWQRFVSVAKPFFVSEKRWRAWGLLLLLCCFSLSVSGLNVLMSYVGRDFMTAFTLKEKDEFIKQVFRYLAAFGVATLVVVFYRYTEERLGLMWRRWLSHYILNRYLTNRAYYRMNWYGAIDNPDQRMSEDVRSFCTQTLSFILIIFNSLIALCSFVGILWSISSWLVIGVVLYAILGSFMTYFLGRRLIGLNFSQLKKEADFRYKMINVRDNSETIAFNRGEPNEFTRTRQRLKIALKNLLQIINWNRNLNFFTTGYNYLVSILPTIIVAPLYLDGKIEFGVVTQAGFAFGHVLNALSIIVLNFQSISAFAAVVTRLGTFNEILSDLQVPQCDPYKGGCIDYSNGNMVEFDHVSILTPRCDQELVKELSFKLENQSLLIWGPSGSGKSSILRAVGGLWSNGTGKVVGPDASKTFFFPQRPYMVIGTLRNQLLYGLKQRGLLDRELEEVLDKVDLSAMLKRVGGLDSQMDWTNILATGEQQRLAFARFLLSKPEFAFLDEATTAVDPSTEEKLYSLLRQHTRTYISIGHKASLADHHDSVLELKGDGGWVMHAVSQGLDLK